MLFSLSIRKSLSNAKETLFFSHLLFMIGSIFLLKIPCINAHANCLSVHPQFYSTQGKFNSFKSLIFLWEKSPKVLRLI